MIVKTIPGTWVAWVRDEHVDWTQLEVHYLELYPTDILVGFWPAKPTSEEVATAVQIVRTARSDG